MLSQAAVQVTVERYTGIALGVGICRTYPSDSHALAVCLNLPLATVTVWFWRRAAAGAST